MVVQWTRGSVSLLLCGYVGTWVHGYVAMGLTLCLLACLLTGLLEEGERQGLTLCLLACLLACSLCCVLRDQCYVMLRRWYVDATWMLRRCYVDATWMLRGWYVDATWTLRGCYVDDATRCGNGFQYISTIRERKKNVCIFFLSFTNRRDVLKSPDNAQTCSVIGNGIQYISAIREW